MVTIGRLVRRPLGAAIGVALLVTAGCGGPAAAPPAPTRSATLADCPAGDGTPIEGVPPLSLPCLTRPDLPVRVSAVHARPELINIWASWCAPCRQEIPLLQAAHSAVGSRVLFLGVDVLDSRSRATRFLAAHDATYPQVFDDRGRFARSLGFVGVPNTLVVDADGRVVYRRAGELSDAQLREALSRVGVDLPG